jgi:hypothetical protein
MYVWGRMARAALTQRRRGPYHLGEESRLSFRCLPTDIDPNLHLNNARYMMLGASPSTSASGCSAGSTGAAGRR